MKTIFELSKPGRQGCPPSHSDTSIQLDLEEKYCRGEDACLPEMTELDIVRHFTKLSRKNFSVDTNFYPLGSCTMKYNPRFSERAAADSGFAHLHPLLPQLSGGHQFVQGALHVIYEMEQLLCEITGMDCFTMQPLAGAHGELTAVMMMAAYHKAKGNKKKYIIIPDSAHGTNPATAAIAGYETISIPSNARGVMDIAKLKEAMSPAVAGLMLTCPNTLGVFNSDIAKISEVIHKVDGLMYYDGANLNAVLGRFRPGDVGFDCMHINLHKTFSTPHGGGGPGAGPVGVKKELMAYLPISRVVKHQNETYQLKYDYPKSIGYIAPFYGNFNVLLKAYAYILLLGKEGLKQVSNHAVLNANYIQKRLKKYLPLAHDRLCLHETVFSASSLLRDNIHALDLAKFLMDKGVHPPTIYFPTIVKEALMIEPTETESKETLDEFIQIMIEAVRISRERPELLKEYPRTLPIHRPDEVKAAKDLDTNYFYQST